MQPVIILSQTTALFFSNPHGQDSQPQVTSYPSLLPREVLAGESLLSPVRAVVTTHAEH